MIYLKYLFVAEFTDGTKIEQNPDDKSKLGGRNCYSDVLYWLREGKRLRRFSLVGDNNIIFVDLYTGIFNVNGLDLLLESEKLPALPDHFDLLWFHQVTRNQNVTYEKKTGEIVKKEDLPEFREYFIGWECEINGKSYKQKLAVA